jgi:NTP pyrophosphatase (non-canonical NTP hydrolase)
VRFRRQGRFHDLVARQLDLFAADDAELLAEAAEAESAWNSASVESAEEAYGDYQLVVDAIADRLLDIRESYARSLDEEAASEYADTFTREATRRYRRYATLLADLDTDLADE